MGTPNMTNTSEKLNKILDEFEDLLIEQYRAEEEEEQRLEYMQKHGLAEGTADRDTLMAICRDYGIDGTDMSIEEMVYALLKLPPGTKTRFFEAESVDKMKLGYASGLMNDIVRYQRSGKKDKIYEKVLLGLYDEYLKLFC